MNKKILSNAIALLLAVLLCLMVAACSSVKQEYAEGGDDPIGGASEQGEIVGDPSTEEPSEQMTEEPAEPTAEPTETPDLQVLSSTEYESDYLAYAEMGEALLAGAGAVEGVFTYTNSNRVFFGFDGEKLVAYAKLRVENLGVPGGSAEQANRVYSEPIAEYPASLGHEAEAKLIEYTGEYLYAVLDTIPMTGFIGDNYVVFTGESFQEQQVHCIFYTDDGENWYELGHNNAHAKLLCGACMANSEVGFLCYTTLRYFPEGEAETTRRLLIYKTEDGGETWQDIRLFMPEEYADSAPNFPLSPVFSGSHGVLPVIGSIFDPSIGNFISYTVWFETNDGGATWDFIKG